VAGGTSFIFEPTPTQSEAFKALNDPASGPLRWMQWARCWYKHLPTPLSER